MSYVFRPFYGSADWAWIQSRVKVLRVEDVRGIMAENEAGDLVGAAIFDTFNHSSAQVTLIMDTPMLVRAGFLQLAYQYLFDICGRSRAYCQVAENNVRSMRLCKKVGWREVARIPDGYADDVDFVIFELRPENFIYTAQPAMWAIK